MAALSRSTIRARLAAGIAALSGFTESRISYDNFGRSPNSMAHKAFAVGVGRTTPRGRPRHSDGYHSDTDFPIRVLVKLRPKARISSYGDGLDVEHAAIKAALGVSLANCQILLDSILSPITDPDGEFARYEFVIRVSSVLALE